MACILVSPYTNIKHLLACLQILDNTIIDDTFIYRDIALIVYCKRTEMTNGVGLDARLIQLIYRHKFN